MQRLFSHFSCHVPETWLDTSTLRFMIPASATLSDPRLVTQKTHGTAGNVVITWERSAGRRPLDFIREQRDELRKSLSRFRLVAESAEPEMPQLEYSFKNGDKQLKQLMCVRAIDDMLICIVGSARETAFETVRAPTLAIAESVATTTNKSTRDP